MQDTFDNTLSSSSKYEDRDDSQGSIEKLTLLSVNSTIIYLLSFIIFFLAYHFATGFTAFSNDLKAKLMFYGTDVYAGRVGWKKMNVIYTYIAGPVICLFLSVVFRYFYIAHYKKRRGYMKLFLLWGFIHGMLFSFGSIITGVVINEGSGIGHAFRWGRVPMGFQYGIAIFSLLILVILGFAITRSFLATSPSQSLIENDFNNRPLFILFVCVIPWAVGSVLIFLLQYPKYYASNMLIWLLMVPILLPALSFSKVNMRVTLNKHKDQVGVQWPYVLACLVVIIIYRIALDYGLDFRFLI